MVSTGTQTEVVMPQMGVSVSEGTITKWLKQVGEPIGRDEPLLEISTDKVDRGAEPGRGGRGTDPRRRGRDGRGGNGARGHRSRGFGRIRASRRASARARSGAEPEPGLSRSPSPLRRRRHPRRLPPSHLRPLLSAISGRRTRDARRCTRAAGRCAPPPAPMVAPAPAPSGNGKTFVSPVVARIAAEHGVDPAVVPGTGTGGRVTKKDILSYLQSSALAAATPPATPEPAVAPVAPEPPRHPWHRARTGAGRGRACARRGSSTTRRPRPGPRSTIPAAGARGGAGAVPAAAEPGVLVPGGCSSR